MSKRRDAMKHWIARRTAMSLPHASANPKRPPFSIPVALAVIGCVFVLTSSALGVDSTLLAGLVVTVLTVAAYVASRFPIATVVLAVFFGQVLDHELRPLLPNSVEAIAVGGLAVRFFDLALFGIVAATAIMIVRQRDRFLMTIARLPTLYLLLIWLGVSAVRGASEAGLVSALGEFRTYYGYLLVVPYLLLHVRQPHDIKRLTRSLVGTGIALLPLSLIVGASTGNLAVGPSTRWLTASSNLAAAAAVITLMILVKQCSRPRVTALSATALVALLVITVLNSHRSVWLAIAIAFLLLVAFRVITASRVLQLAMVGLVTAVVAGSFLPGGTTELTTYVQLRARAFTDYEEDPTANWRAELWSQAVAEIADRPLAGKGLGNGFAFTTAGGELVTTSPHNMYLTLVYHAGLIGLGLYVAFTAALLWRLLRSSRLKNAGSLRVIATAGVVVGAAAHGYYLAYALDLFTWLVMGAAATAALLPRNSGRGNALPKNQTHAEGIAR